MGREFIREPLCVYISRIRRGCARLILIGMLSLSLACQNNSEKPYAKLAPPQTRKIRVHFQTSPNTCGPAALLSICEFYGIKTTEQEIATLAGTTPTGTSLHGLARAADSLGLKATGMELSLEELKGAKTPLIAHLNGGHFVVVVSVHKGQLTVIDPAKGVKSIAPVNFNRNASSHLATRKGWQGYVLLLEPSSLSRGEKSTQDVMEQAGR